MIQPYNLHTHTFRCKHATGDVEDYVRVAEAGGCTLLGMSDHAPWPKGSDAIPGFGGRMSIDEFPAYKAAVMAARVAHPRMKIPLAVECEYRPEWRQFYQHLLCDYLIGSVHVMDNSWTMASYTDACVATMQADMFAFLAHPDQFWFEQRQWNAEVEACARAIITAAAQTRTPLEINGNRALAICASTPGTLPPFWEMAARYGVKVVLNSDAHKPENTLQHYDIMATMRDRCGLKEAELVI